MVAAKGKSKVGLTQKVEDGQPRKRVGGRSLKVFSENEDPKMSDGRFVLCRGVTNKGAKGGFQSMEKNSGKYSSSANMNVRKALADVSNVQGSSAKNTKWDASKMNASTRLVGALRKSFTGRLQRKVSQDGVQLGAAKTGGQKINANGGSSTVVTAGRVLASANRRLGDASSSKSFTGRLQKKVSQDGVQLGTSKTDDQKFNKNGRRSTVVTESRTARNSLTAITSRRSLPVPRRVNTEDTSRTKDNATSSETAKKISGIPTKAAIGRKVSSQITSSRSHLRKARASDGFVQINRSNLGSRVQTNVIQGTSRKSTKPLVKTTIKASNATTTAKSKSKPGLNKSASTTAVLSQDDKAVASSSLAENNLVGVTSDENEREIPSGGDCKLRTNSLEIIGRKKSGRRKSYTTSLMEGSKFLKPSVQVTEEDNLPNIDNECNQLEVSEYIDEIYQYYWLNEAQNSALANYMSIQTDITPQMRGILINWLIEVHFKFDLMPETLYLTVSLLDQYLSLVTIKTNDMQLVGLTALLLASKYEDFWHPRVKELISISAESYTRDQMLGMEKLILRKLKFRLNAPTPYVFMVRFLRAAQSDKKLEHLAFFLIELCLVENEALAFKPSLLCASAVYVARCTLQITPTWTPLLHKHARYEVSQIRDCAEMILKFHKSSRTGKLKVTYEKYSRPQLSGVTKVKPLDRLPL